MATPPPPPAHLLCFGFGYVARALAPRLRAAGFEVTGTHRSAGGRAAAEGRAAQGRDVATHVFDGEHRLPDPVVDRATHVLVSVPPDEAGDPVLAAHAADLQRSPNLVWVGLLGTTGVYGDTEGAWVDEASTCAPTSERGRRRLRAEALWLASGLPVHVFRLAGIYGPDRNAFTRLERGDVQAIEKPGHVFSRIHVDDIVQGLCASIAQPQPGAIYNVADDEPASSADVVREAARLAGRPMPPTVAFEAASLSPMARSFYAESRRVSNARLRHELGVVLRYPTYREGLAALSSTLPPPDPTAGPP